MSSKIVIAIDGPAGVGKSSVGKDFASKINYKFISSGKMYRALAFKALEKGISPDNESELLKLASSSFWEFKSSGGPEPVLYLDGRPLDSELTDEKIGKATSSVARLFSVREFLVKKQREIGSAGGIVMEGRDIGTNVFPDAPLKFYLDASAQARAKRRVYQLNKAGLKADYEEILAMIISRDEQDSKRAHNPLKKARDAVYIDSTNMTREEVCSVMLKAFFSVTEGK
ncbi:MAG: (d)CMP kinase [Elusimicrobia bacterium]|nr:(d)CMP kinase [Elusimicrobiota bacterium]